MATHPSPHDACFKVAHVEFDRWAGNPRMSEIGKTPTTRPACRGGREDKLMSDQEGSCGDNPAAPQPLLKGVGLHTKLETDKASAKRIALFLNVSPPSHLAKWSEHQGIIVYTFHNFLAFGAPKTALMIAKRLIRERTVIWLHGRVTHSIGRFSGG